MLKWLAGKAPSCADKLEVGSYLACEMVAQFKQSREEESMMISIWHQGCDYYLPDVWEHGSEML